MWRHDTSLIAPGMARYGYAADAWRLMDALLDAAAADALSRLPELYAGYARLTVPHLVPYPVACAPQAWSTGAIVLMVQTLLGLQPGDEGPSLQPIPAGPYLRLTDARVGGWRGSIGNVAERRARPTAPQAAVPAIRRF